MLSGSGWSADLYGRLSSSGFLGSELMQLTDAVGIGSATHVTGKAFATTDVGTITGVGVGTGVGITGLVESSIAMTMYANAVGSFGQAGSELLNFCQAAAASCVAQLALATLTSADTPVFAGAGTVIVGSITVVPSAWSSSIQGQAPNFLGSQWPNFAQAIGDAQAQGVISDGTGTLVITGSLTVPPPLPGAGAGTGVVS